MKILIVDDSSLAQRIIARFMKKAMPNAEIYIEQDGQSGYQRFCEIKPDLLLTDLLMPGLNGFELLKLVQKHDHQALVFVISADIQKAVRGEVESLGAKAFLAKPFNEDKAQYIAKLAAEMAKSC